VPSASLRQRRRAEEDDEELDRPAGSRPWWWRLLLRRPLDTLAFLVLMGAASAVVVNSVYLQHGPHPAPIFAVHPLPVAAARDTAGEAQRLRASDLAAPRREAVEVPRTRAIAAPAAPAAPHKDVIAELIAENPAPPPHAAAPARQPAAPPTHQAAAPPALAPTRSLAQPSRQVLAAQQALSEFGYGQIKPTGIYDADTRAAVERFERDRKLPVTGELSESVKRELAKLTGRDLN
jgi:hypothetical protein